jgi:hypothetical protein
MTCALALDDTPLPDMEEVYRIAAARVTLAVREGRIELALRWGRILNLALRDRGMRARLPVAAGEVDRPEPPEPPAPPDPEPSGERHASYLSHPVSMPLLKPTASPLFTYRRWPFREGERRR